MANKIQNDLKAVGDKKFAMFNAKLLPNLDSKTIIGIRTPWLRKYALTVQSNDAFLNTLPHKYFEENQLHAFALSNIKDFDFCIKKVDDFLPYVDNWATCDQLIPKTFAKNTDTLLPWIQKWIKSKHVYTVRFAIGILMRFYLDDKFDLKYAQTVSQIQSKEYYINMMRAWYFATALAKQWDKVIFILENKSLDLWTHNKTIQKAKESYRITPEQKQYLDTLKQ